MKAFKGCGFAVVGKRLAPGAVGLHVASGVALLHPEEQLFAAMLDGWRNQQLARNLSFSSISNRERAVKALAGHAQSFPWLWAPQMVDEWMGDMRDQPSAPVHAAQLPGVCPQLLRLPHRPGLRVG